jgi:hydroxyacylglutathione hydrolase
MEKLDNKLGDNHAMSHIKLQIYELPPLGTNAYFMFDEQLGEAALFDAPFGAKDEVDKQLKRFGVTLTGVWLTHGHWDHMLDAHAFNKARVPVYAHKADEVMINRPDTMASFSIPGIQYNPARIDHYLENNEQLRILGEKVRVVHVPGHSAGSVAFVFEDLHWVISGDVIFAGSVGRTDFPGCSHEVLMNSISTNIMTLDDDTILYPGHGPKTTVGKERSLNPFIRE